MVFVRAKKVGDKIYYQLVESYRPHKGSSPRQRVLLHLGSYSTVEEALKKWPKDLERLRDRTTACVINIDPVIGCRHTGLRS